MVIIVGGSDAVIICSSSTATAEGPTRTEPRFPVDPDSRVYVMEESVLRVKEPVVWRHGLIPRTGGTTTRSKLLLVLDVPRSSELEEEESKESKEIHLPIES